VAVASVHWSAVTVCVPSDTPGTAAAASPRNTDGVSAAILKTTHMQDKLYQFTSSFPKTLFCKFVQ